MAAVIICSDFGAQENKVCHCFHFFPTYLPWSDGTKYHNSCFLNVEFWASFYTFLFHFHQEALLLLSQVNQNKKNFFYLSDEKKIIKTQFLVLKRCVNVNTISWYQFVLPFGTQFVNTDGKFYCSQTISYPYTQNSNSFMKWFGKNAKIHVHLCLMYQCL